MFENVPFMHLMIIFLIISLVSGYFGFNSVSLETRKFSKYLFYFSLAIMAIATFARFVLHYGA